MIDGRGAAVGAARVVFKAMRITDAGPGTVSRRRMARAGSRSERGRCCRLIDAHVHLKGWPQFQSGRRPDNAPSFGCAARGGGLPQAALCRIHPPWARLRRLPRSAPALCDRRREIPGPRILTAYRGLSQTGRVKKGHLAADVTPLR